MDIYLIRHADALSLEAAGVADDDDRPLSPQGREQACRLGSLFARRAVRFDALVSSPLVRARETALLMLTALPEPTPRLLEDEELGFDLRPKRVAKHLQTLRLATVGLIGHEPTLSRLLGWLIGGRRAQVAMEKAGIALLTGDTPGKGGATLEWLVGPEWY